MRRITTNLYTPRLVRLWPLYGESIVIDVIAYDSMTWNVVFLFVALVPHVVFY